MVAGLRKLLLTLHVTVSVGWLGAVVAFLALTLTALASQDVQTVRAAYLIAEPITRFAIVPLALASLLTGIVQSVATPWGLFRHYWVVFKLMLTVLATLVLVQYTQTVSYFANLAVESEGGNIAGLWSYLLHAAGGLLVLLATTALSVYKPRGLTPWGRYNAGK
jgi:hypothetical protein